MFGINQLGQAQPQTASELYDQAARDRAAANKWLLFIGLMLATAFVYDATKK
jgi:hypothetical protein